MRERRVDSEETPQPTPEWKEACKVCILPPVWMLALSLNYTKETSYSGKKMWGCHPHKPESSGCFVCYVGYYL